MVVAMVEASSEILGEVEDNGSWAWRGGGTQNAPFGSGSPPKPTDWSAEDCRGGDCGCGIMVVVLFPSDGLELDR